MRFEIPLREVGSKTVQCLVLDPNSIGVAHNIQHLSVGNQGVLRQIDDTNRIARFCRSSQLGTTETAQIFLLASPVPQLAGIDVEAEHLLKALFILTSEAARLPIHF